MPLRTKNSNALVNEMGLATGTAGGANTSDIFSGALTAQGAPGPYTFTLSGSGTGKYGTLSLKAERDLYLHADQGL